MSTSPAAQTSTTAPSIGDGATILCWSDRKAATVVSVSPSGKSITLQHDHCTLLNGPTSEEPDALECHPGGFSAHVSGTQRWETSPNPDGILEVFTLRSNGRYVLKGQPARGGRSCKVGQRRPHYDFNF